VPRSGTFKNFSVPFKALINCIAILQATYLNKRGCLKSFDIAVAACISTNQKPKERGGASRRLSLLVFPKPILVFSVTLMLKTPKLVS
jgi:hypothetical protein